MKFDLTNRETVFASLDKGGVGAEIGVANGVFSEKIMALAEPQLLYLVDCWEHLPVEVTGNDPSNEPQASKDAHYLRVLRTFIADPRVHVVKGYSLTVASLFPTSFFDWLYLDANHLLCYADIMAFWPTLKSGGWMMGHDYLDVSDCFTVKTDVDRFVAETGHELLVTVDADTNYKSWIVRKP